MPQSYFHTEPVITSYSIHYTKLYELGNVFNQLAVQFSPDLPVAHELVMIIILIIGHAINIFLASLGAFVHPLRLTFVEFYKNAGFTGGGVAYSPLK